MVERESLCSRIYSLLSKLNILAVGKNNKIKTIHTVEADTLNLSCVCAKKVSYVTSKEVMPLFPYS